ncbi:50S ribosomal protein L19 [Candidatus Peregrinibacteria bacterium]|nr:50S ribosomal protein L19 [Candidatus Peregrinibacteria bacterium]
MNLLQEVQKLAIKKNTPEIRPGYTVRVSQKIKEGEKERIQAFEGLVIRINSGYGADKTITVRKVVDGIGVERIFPLCSPTITKIEVKKTSKVRRAKLFYMRDRSGKSAKLRGSFVSDKNLAGNEARDEAQPNLPAPEPSTSEKEA